MFFLLMLLKKHVRSICYLNNMCFSHAKGHMSILYVGCRKFLTNRFVGNLCPFSYWGSTYNYVLGITLVQESLRDGLLLYLFSCSPK
jgi:hypothetical protein